MKNEIYKSMKNYMDIVKQNIKEPIINKGLFDDEVKVKKENVNTEILNKIAEKIEDHILRQIYDDVFPEINHEDFAFINLKLKNIIEEQEKISKDIIENNEILDKLKENIDNNVLLMKNNLEFLNKKIK